MKRKQQTKTFMIISNWSPWFIQKYLSVARVKHSGGHHRPGGLKGAVTECNRPML